MKEEWLMPGAVVPVDLDTTKALVDEIKRLIGVIGGMALQARSAPVQEPVFCEYCGGNDDADFGLPTDHCTDCARPQPAAQRQWVGLMDEERRGIREWQKIQDELGPVWSPMMLYLYMAIEAKLKEKNT